MSEYLSELDPAMPKGHKAAMEERRTQRKVRKRREARKRRKTAVSEFWEHYRMAVFLLLALLILGAEFGVAVWWNFKMGVWG